MRPMERAAFPNHLQSIFATEGSKMSTSLTEILVGLPLLVTSIFLGDTELHNQQELSRAIGVCHPYRCVKYTGSDDHYHHFQETGKFGELGPSNKFRISKDLISIPAAAVDKSMTYDQNRGLFKIIGLSEPERIIRADFVEKYTREEERYLEAVARLKRYSKSDTSEHKADALRKAMMASYFAKHLDEASNYAHELIELVSRKSDFIFFRVSEDDYSDSVYVANSVLGFVALKNGDINQAKMHLIASAKVPGSAVLRSFGPNPALARALLVAGEKQTVLEYLTLCEKFWNTEELRTWKSMVEDDKMPPFNPYLTH